MQWHYLCISNRKSLKTNSAKMRNSWQLSKKMNKMQNYAEMGNPCQVKKKMNKMQHINNFIQNFTQQLQLRKAFNQSLKWHSCIMKVETFEFWDMRTENQGSRVKNQERDMMVMLVTYGDVHHPIIIKQMVEACPANYAIARHQNFLQCKL